jgi:hypothetical protein
VVSRLLRAAPLHWWRPVRARPVRARLYLRAECELCEQAQALLREFEQAGRLDLRVVAIDHDPALQRRYGITIPVLEIEGGPCLEWPFDRSEVRRALR